VIQADDQEQYALPPLDDELLDFLLERSPKFIEECEQIRRRTTSGESHSQDEIERLLEESGVELQKSQRKPSASSRGMNLARREATRSAASLHDASPRPGFGKFINLLGIRD